MHNFMIYGIYAIFMRYSFLQNKFFYCQTNEIIGHCLPLFYTVYIRKTTYFLLYCFSFICFLSAFIISVIIKLRFIPGENVNVFKKIQLLTLKMDAIISKIAFLFRKYTFNTLFTQKLISISDFILRNIAILYRKIAVLHREIAVLHGEIAVLHGEITILTGKIDILHRKITVLPREVAILYREIAVLDRKFTILTGKFNILTVAINQEIRKEGILAVNYTKLQPENTETLKINIYNVRLINLLHNK